MIAWKAIAWGLKERSSVEGSCSEVALSDDEVGRLQRAATVFASVIELAAKHVDAIEERAEELGELPQDHSPGAALAAEWMEQARA